MRILIVDDEPLAVARLRALIEEDDLGTVVGEAGNGVAALKLVDSLSPEVVLLDIRMPGMDGLETAQHIDQLATRPAVVFTTAYDDHALAAFDANATDYLLKPIRANRLRRALEKVRPNTSGRVVVPTELAQDQRTHLSGFSSGNLTLVAIEKVKYLQADQGYVDVVWEDDSMLIEESLKSLEDEFNDTFVRVHRNALVAAAHVDGLLREDNGTYVVTIEGSDVRLPVSRRLLSQVRQRLR